MFDHILEDYLAQLIVTGRSHATQRAARSDLTQFCTWWEHTYQRPFDLTQVMDSAGCLPIGISRVNSTARLA